MTAAAPGRPDREYWFGLLDPDETLIWAGAPDGPPSRDLIDWGQMIFGLFFALFAVNFMLMAGFPFNLFASLHLGVGLGIAFGFRAWKVRVFRRARYALTDRRAIVAVGGKVSTWPVSPQTPLEIDAGSPGSVMFEPDDDMNMKLQRFVPRLRGFERIQDARQVYRMIRSLQTGEGADA